MVDVIYFVGGLRWLGFTNHLFVWGVVSLLGFAWLDDSFPSVGCGLSEPVLGFATLPLLIHIAPYSVAVIRVPCDPISNTTLPKVILIAPQSRGWVVAGRSTRAPLASWPGYVDSNCGSQWQHHDAVHLATVLFVFAAYLAGGFGLRFRPGSSEWWWSRFLWLAATAIVLVPLVVVFGRLGRAGACRHYVLGALMTVAGFALLAAHGVDGYGRFGLNVWGIALALAAVGLLAERIERRGALSS